MRLRSSLLASFLLAGGLTLATPAAPACAAGSSAVLVVATGGSTYRYCVTLPSGSVSGLDLIKLASEQHGLQYSLGYGGRAVCQLAGVGPEGDDCFADHPNFWGYWRGDGSGGWTWSGTGAGSTTVTSGDVEGWSWGSGQDGNSHPQPPSTTYESICTTSSGTSGGGTSSGSGGGAKPKPKATPPPGTTEGTTEADNRSDLTEGAAEADDGTNESPNKSKKKPAGDDDADAEEELAAGDDEGDDAQISDEPVLLADEGPPVAGIVGIGLALLFGGLGAMLAARRQRRRG